MLGCISCISCLFTVVIVAFYLYSCCYSVILQFSCLSYYLSYLMYAVYLVIILCTLFICTSTFLYTHTHQVAFSRPWLCTSRYWTLCFYCSVFIEAIRFAKNWSFSLFDSGILIFFAFILFPDSRYIRFSRYSSSWFIWYRAWMLICDIAVIMIKYSFDL